LPAGSSDAPEVKRGPRNLVLVLLRVGFTARRRYRRRGSSPIVSPTPRIAGPSPLCGTFPWSLRAAV